MKFSYKSEGNLIGPVPYPQLPGPESRFVSLSAHRHMVSNRPKDTVKDIGINDRTVPSEGAGLEITAAGDA
ncbi:hypothetical protein V6N11_075728 [Hibiscus sabdariffa]|uniref:Uncharacterized protein n=1 Tax=Hibiscus sabdariffa TaxID=183260 RepID=A0ABR1Z8S7_9ROSI